MSKWNFKLKTQYILGMKYFDTNLTKNVWDLYEENYKTLMKEIKEELNKWKDVPYSWTVRLNIVKFLVLSKLIYGFSAISTKIPASYFVRLTNWIWNLYGKAKDQDSQYDTEEKQNWSNYRALRFTMELQ
jgi:hypothetical protein